MTRIPRIDSSHRLAAAVACGLVLTLACVTPPPLDPESSRLYHAALDRWLERAVRLHRVHQQMRLAGAPLCEGHTTPVLGIVAVHPSELPHALRGAGVERFGRRNEAPTVIAVLPRSAAEAAGVRVGDRVLRIGRSSVVRTRFIHSPRPTQAAEIAVGIVRTSRVMELSLPAIPGCDSRIELADTDGLNAYAIGKDVVFFSGLLRILERDEALAFVIGHELAHQIEAARSGRRSRKRDAEAAADYVGAYLAERAGYRLKLDDFGVMRAAHAQPRRLLRESRSHPSTPTRHALFRHTLEEIAAKRARGVDLTPGRLDP